MSVRATPAHTGTSKGLTEGMAGKETMPPRTYKPPDVSAHFFAYAAGLDRDSLLRLRLTRYNTRANLRQRIGALLDDYFDTLNEIRCCNWLLRSGEPAVSSADAAFLRQCGIAHFNTSRRHRRGQPHRDHSRVAHVA